MSTRDLEFRHCLRMELDLFCGCFREHGVNVPPCFNATVVMTPTAEGAIVLCISSETNMFSGMDIPTVGMV